MAYHLIGILSDADKTIQQVRGISKNANIGKPPRSEITEIHKHIENVLNETPLYSKWVMDTTK